MDELVNDTAGNCEEQPSEGYSFQEILELAKELKEEIDDFRDILLRYRHQIRIREPDWLNSYETMRLLKISRSTLIRYRKQRVIRYSMVNGLCKYRYIDVLTLLSEK